MCIRDRFHAMFSIMLFCTVFMMYPRAEVSAKRIEEVFNLDPIIKNKPADSDFDEKVSIEFDHVTFVYPDGEEPVCLLYTSIHAGCLTVSSDLDLLLVHAEDMLISVQLYKSLIKEFIDIYKKI